jgi:hypothetical protein
MTDNNETNNNETNNNETNNNETNNNETTNNNVKKIIIVEEIKTKKIKCEKEKKMRVETKTWGLQEDDLSHEKQLSILKCIQQGVSEKNKYVSMFTSHIKTKICSYRQQDILKKKLNKALLVKFEEVINLLNTCELKCCYCAQEVYILYEKVREMKQWSLDRINNDIGHNAGNLVIACLECNLKRRRTNKDAFMFTKNMVIIKEA